MTSRECFENKWFYMKYIGKYLSGEMYNKKSIKLCFNKTELQVAQWFYSQMKIL
jgi:hypothetical protein